MPYFAFVDTNAVLDREIDNSKKAPSGRMHRLH